MSPKADFIVARFVPRDIHRYSHAAAAAVLLAAALDWDIVERPNKATILRGPDGVIVEVPDSTNLKFNVFRSWVRKITTHSVEFVLTREVADHICAAAKLSPDHARVITDFAEQSLVPDATPDTVDEKTEEPYILTREPYQAHLGGGTTYTSGASFKRTWSDGHVDWECVVCGQAFNHPKALGGHRQKHIKEGQAEADHQDRIRESVRGYDPDWVPDPYGPREPGQQNGSEPEPDLPLTEEEWQPFAEAVGIEPESEPELRPVEVTEPAPALETAFAELGHYVQAVLDENAQLKQQLMTMRANVAAMLSLIQELQAE